MADRVIKYNEFKGADGWGIDDFIAWHRGLVQQYGNKKAITKAGTPSSVSLADYWFIKLWLREGMPTKIQSVMLLPSSYKEQIAYFKKYPTLYEVLGFKTIEEVKKYNPVNTAANVVATTNGIVEDISSTVGSVVKIIKVVAIVAVLGGSILGGIYLYNKTKTA